MKAVLNASTKSAETQGVIPGNDQEQVIDTQNIISLDKSVLLASKEAAKTEPDKDWYPQKVMRQL